MFDIFSESRRLAMYDAMRVSTKGKVLQQVNDINRLFDHATEIHVIWPRKP
jgi:hypothetical protein